MSVEQKGTLAAHVRSALLPVLPIVLVTLLMGLLAWRVSADESFRFGTEADRIYIADGFYDPEQSPDLGTYRWTHPLAQMQLPNWGPGRIHLIAEGVAGAQGRIALKLGATTLAETDVQQGQPWQLQGWGETTERTPAASLESPPFQPPGEGRELGLLVQGLEIYAPDARLRAGLDITLLGLAGLLLYVFLLFRTGRTLFASIAGTAIPALFSPLAAFRDPWMDTVAWTAPLALTVVLLLHRFIRPPQRPQVSRITYHGTHHAAFATIALSSALLLLYLGFMNAFDSDRMYDMTAGFAEYFKPTRYPGLETWTKYGFGQSLIAVPFYLIGKLFDLLGGNFEPVTRLTVSFTNLVITTLTVLLLYKAARLVAGVTVSLAVSATYLLATPALNYGRTFFSEPAGGLLMLAAILLVLPAADDRRQTTDDRRQEKSFLSTKNALLAGLCLGAMLLFKPAFAIYWVPIGLAVLVRSVSKGTTDTRQAGQKPSSIIYRLSSIAAFAVGPILALLIQAWYNYVRYSPLPDAIFRTGYEKEEGFNTPLLEGLGGLLFSPGKSILLYAPVILLAPLGLWLMFRRGGTVGKFATVLIISEVAIGFLFNAMWWAWTGNFAWGPRLIMPILPLLVWALASLDERRRMEDDGMEESRITNYELHSQPPPSIVYRLSSIIWPVLAVLGALVNIPGAMVDFQAYYRSYGLLLAGQPGEEITIYDPANSPLLVEPGYLLDGLTAAIYRPSLASVGMPPVWDMIVPLILVVVSVACLWLATRPSQPSRNKV